MRKNQISIKVERFGDQVPTELDSTHQVISVYADSNNFSHALFEAIYLLMQQVEGEGTDDTTASIESTMAGQQLSEDYQRKLYRKLSDESFELNRKRKAVERDLFVAEHQKEIFDAVYGVETKAEAIENIQELFPDEFKHTIARTPQMISGFSLKTKEEIEDLREELAELNERYAIVSAQADACKSK